MLLLLTCETFNCLIKWENLSCYFNFDHIPCKHHKFSLNSFYFNVYVKSFSYFLELVFRFLEVVSWYVLWDRVCSYVFNDLISYKLRMGNIRTWFTKIAQKLVINDRYREGQFYICSSNFDTIRLWKENTIWYHIKTLSAFLILHRFGSISPYMITSD